MEKTSEENVAVDAEQRGGTVYDEYSCSNILICKCPLREVIRAIFFKCFGFETSTGPAAAACCSDESCSCPTPDVKEMDPPPPSSTKEPVPLPCPPSSTPGPTVDPEDVTRRFRQPPRRPPTKGSGPETNSSGNS
ncbi:hypothetical protein POM88_004669 [Heracleum sosnowskyi]|uniref:Uncharacterized protein n=1 Tax=Heracleum sosnowskyi TaxID=360622 RepID=A0AAD8NCR8_9APIA|nr:hypothetical protein POM88_004669 [Heracleum sosnowskyi]